MTWEDYLAAHASAVQIDDPAAMDALRREFGYPTRRRWWRW